MISLTEEQVAMLMRATRSLDDETKRRTFADRLTARLRFHAGGLQDDDLREVIGRAMKGLGRE
jgi:hypothetical protein